jgi:hypothetical protein
MSTLNKIKGGAGFLSQPTTQACNMMYCINRYIYSPWHKNNIHHWCGKTDGARPLGFPKDYGHLLPRWHHNTSEAILASFIYDE